MTEPVSVTRHELRRTASWLARSSNRRCAKSICVSCRLRGLTYFFCYVDRINVGFAALTMNKDLGLDPAMFGLASGAFFWGYFLFEVPSNIILEKVGARLWIARIMVTWGLLSAATALCTGPWSFLTVRFLLGVAEAGFFPGLVLYFTHWFPDHHRARILAGFTLALPIAVALGAPMSTALLELNGLLGLRGWQWLFLLEAVPTVLLGVAVLFYLTDRPEQAKFLSPKSATGSSRRSRASAGRSRGTGRSRCCTRSGTRPCCCCR